MDAKKARELTKLINICKKLGVLELKVDGIELKLAPAAVLKESKYKQKKSEASDEEITTPYSDEDTLFWSSTGIPPEAQ
jgi:hypothetical protein